MDTDITRRPVTPPFENNHKEKSAVLADMNDPTTTAHVASARTAKPTNTTKATRKMPTSSESSSLDRSDTQPSVGSQASLRQTTDSTGFQRNDTTRRIERDVLSLLQWENPARSAFTLALLVGSILLTGSYSLLQIGAGLLTIAIGLNLVYVTFVVQTQKVFSDNNETLHPYRSVIGQNDQLATVDKRMVHHYSSLTVDIAETVIRALARIVFIEDSMTSFKWLMIFYLTWTVSVHLSSRTIILSFIVSAFIFPRLYISNKGIVDAHIQQGEAILRSHWETAQNKASDGLTHAVAKAKTYVAMAGTTPSDAKNSLFQTSATLKKTE